MSVNLHVIVIDVIVFVQGVYIVIRLLKKMFETEGLDLRFLKSIYRSHCMDAASN